MSSPSVPVPVPVLAVTVHVAPLPLDFEAPVPRQINQALERVIRACPAQYLWSYNRYKIPRGVSAPSPHSPLSTPAS